jgi:hypothetical protein
VRFQLGTPARAGSRGHTRFNGDSAPETGTQLHLNLRCAFTEAESATQGDSESPEATFSPHVPIPGVRRPDRRKRAPIGQASTQSPPSMPLLVLLLPLHKKGPGPKRPGPP